jgi:hypothetical protein
LNLLYITSLFTVAVAEALTHVTSLEAELKITSKALKDANTAKTAAEKNAKVADALASKAEKALDEVAKKQATRKGAVVE